MAAAIGKAQPHSCVNGDHRRRALPELGLGGGHRGRAAGPGLGALCCHVRIWALYERRLQIMQQQNKPEHRAEPTEGLNPNPQET